MADCYTVEYVHLSNCSDCPNAPIKKEMKALIVLCGYRSNHFQRLEQGKENVVNRICDFGGFDFFLYMLLFSKHSHNW